MGSLRRSPLDGWCARALGAQPAELGTAALARWQREKLIETVRWARERSRWYRERLPADFSGEVQALPFLTPEQLREHGARLVCVSQDEISRVVTLQSSGTTGASKRVFFTEAEQESIIDFFAAGMSTLVERGDRVVIALPGPTEGSVGSLLSSALKRLGARPVLNGFVRDVGAAARLLVSEQPTSLVALPVHALALARHLECTAPGSVTLRSALLTADYVPTSLARHVERALGCRVFEHYGMTEMGLGGGVECEAHQGYHLREADLLFEVVDPATGHPAPDGTPGEVVFSTLTRRGMPLLRYRTGDQARFLPGPCPCGSTLRRLGRVQGRLDAARLGAFTLPMLDEIVFDDPEVVDYQARLIDQSGAITLRSLELSGINSCAQARGALLAALPGLAVQQASLSGVLSSGPAKRALAGGTAPGHGS